MKVTGTGALVGALIFAGALALIDASGRKFASSSCADAGDIGDMIWIPGGTFAMGAENFFPEEGPVREVKVNGFWMSAHEITNAEFARFVEETGYVTVAERGPQAEEFAGAPEGSRQPGSAVFQPPASLSGDVLSWWTYVPGANWRAPAGPGSSLDARENYPVVHIAYEDAKAYAEWAGGALPTEAQWELAARGGLDGAPYAWGNEFTPAGAHQANTWQGVFPVQNSKEDGYSGAAPVGCFPPNGYGLYDMIGNVWEWTADSYAPHGGQSQGPELGVIKGGSFLCSPDFCARYRPAARQPQEAGLGASHIGFRIAARSETQLHKMRAAASR